MKGAPYRPDPGAASLDRTLASLALQLRLAGGVAMALGLCLLFISPLEAGSSPLSLVGPFALFAAIAMLRARRAAIVASFLVGMVMTAAAAAMADKRGISALVLAGVLAGAYYAALSLACLAYPAKTLLRRIFMSTLRGTCAFVVLGIVCVCCYARRPPASSEGRAPRVDATPLRYAD